MEPLSPELALVDPLLAAHARAGLPTSDILAALETRRATEEARRGAFAKPVLALFGLGAVAWMVFVGVGGDARPDRAASPPVVAAPAAPEHAAPSTPAGRTLSWRARPHARFYRVKVLANRGALKPGFLFDVWTAIPQLPVPSTRLDHGRPVPLAAGTYRWVVYPEFGANKRVASGTNAARPIAAGSFSVPPAQ